MSTEVGFIVEVLFSIFLGGFLPISTILGHTKGVQNPASPLITVKSVVAVVIASAFLFAMNYQSATAIIVDLTARAENATELVINYFRTSPTDTAIADFAPVDDVWITLTGNHHVRSESDLKQLTSALGAITQADERNLPRLQLSELAMARAYAQGLQESSIGRWKEILNSHPNDALTPLAQAELVLLTPPPRPPSIVVVLAAEAAYQANLQAGQPFDRSALIQAVHSVTAADEANLTDDEKAKLGTARKLVADWEQKAAPAVPPAAQCGTTKQTRQALDGGLASLGAFGRCEPLTHVGRLDEAKALISFGRHSYGTSDEGTKRPSDLPEAIEALQIAVALTAADKDLVDDEADARRWLGRLEFLDGRQSEGIVELRRSTAIRPDAHTLNALGNMYKDIAELDTALVQFDASIAAAKAAGVKYPIAYVNKGMVLDAQGKYREALDAFALAEQNKGDSVKYLIGECITYRHMKRYDSSIFTCDLAKQATQSHGIVDVSPFIEEGMAYLDLADYASAKRQFEQAVRLSPLNKVARDLLEQARGHL